MSDNTEIVQCINNGPHKFIANNPAPGMWGRVIIFCEKCGREREEVRR